MTWQSFNVKTFMEATQIWPLLKKNTILVFVVLNAAVVSKNNGRRERGLTNTMCELVVKDIKGVIMHKTVELAEDRDSFR